MQTYLIVSSNPLFINSEIEKIKKRLNVSSINLHKISSVSSIGIADARNIKKILSRKPFAGGERLIIIKGMEKATNEAANALLKILEEPPQKTFIILTSDSLESLLPTVVSRCQIISEQKFQSSTDLDEVKNTAELIKKVFISSPGERILLSQKIVKSKEEALQLLDRLLAVLDLFLRSTSFSGVDLSRQDAALIIRKIVAAKSYIESNVNYKATIDILFLGFPKKERP